MAQESFVRLLVLVACCFLEASSRPSNNESPTPFKVEIPREELLEEETQGKRERSLPIVELKYPEIQDDNTDEILEKIKAINEGLKKPQRQKVNYYAQPHTGGGYVIDRETLEKIQQIIASGKLHTYSQNQKQQDSNSLINDDSYIRYSRSRAMQYVQPTIKSNTLTENQAAIAMMPVPYLTSLPVLVMPTAKSVYGGYSDSNDLSYVQPYSAYQTRQIPPTLPFQIQWPLAPYFPILIKDPLLTFLQGGSWENLLEYGQSADVCNRKQKSTEEKILQNISEQEDKQDSENDITVIKVPRTRQGRAIKKRTISKSAQDQEIDIHKNKKFLRTKVSTTEKPTKKPSKQRLTQDIKHTYDDEGDLRFPFGDFTWFGNRKPVAPSPGFFINRLKVRRGGVAIAGPGGVATAGRGGTAVVGPGGLAYTQPGGLAVAGPAAKVVALSSDVNLNNIVTRLQAQSAVDGSVPRLLQAIPEGKVVATGPVIYYHPTNL